MVGKKGLCFTEAMLIGWLALQKPCWFFLRESMIAPLIMTDFHHQSWAGRKDPSSHQSWAGRKMLGRGGMEHNKMGRELDLVPHLHSWFCEKQVCMRISIQLDVEWNCTKRCSSHWNQRIKLNFLKWHKNWTWLPTPHPYLILEVNQQGHKHMHSREEKQGRSCFSHCMPCDWTFKPQWYTWMQQAH